MQASHHTVWWHWLIVLHEVDTVPKDGRYFLIKLSLRETLEEITAGVFEYARLNDEHAGDWCLYDVHDDWLLIIDYWLLIIDYWLMMSDCWLLIADDWWVIIDYW